MPTIANCNLLAHLTADPEPITGGTQQGVRFRVWTSEKPKKDAEKVFTHFRCAAWGKEAEWLLRDGRKGGLVFLSGSFRLESFEKNDGSKGHSIEVRCSTVRLVDRVDGEKPDRDDTAPAAPAAPRRPAAPAARPVDDDAIPF